MSRLSVIHSVYIVEPIDNGWIIERLMRDIGDELNRRGIATAIGPSSGYAEQEVLFNSRYLTPFFDQRARVTSLFITHVDDAIRERELRSTFRRFNSFVCLSEHDAGFVAGLKGDRQGVVGIELPARNINVRPMRVAIFSAFYEDGRKNEKWILEYLAQRSKEHRRSFIFCFLGLDWEAFCDRLRGLDASYELYRYSRELDAEYDRYREVLAGADKLIYMGFDGGAMSVYDALSSGIDVIAPNMSYHRGLGGSVSLFDTREEFFAELDKLHDVVAGRRNALRTRSIASYVDRLTAHWLQLGNFDAADPQLQVSTAEAETVALFRGHYKKLGFSRIRSACIRAIQGRSAALGPRR